MGKEVSRVAILKGSTEAFYALWGAGFFIEENEKLFRGLRQRNDMVKFAFYLDNLFDCIKDTLEVNKTSSRQRHLTRVIQ